MFGNQILVLVTLVLAAAGSAFGSAKVIDKEICVSGSPSADLAMSKLYSKLDAIVAEPKDENSGREVVSAVLELKNVKLTVDKNPTTGALEYKSCASAVLKGYFPDFQLPAPDPAICRLPIHCPRGSVNSNGHCCPMGTIACSPPRAGFGCFLPDTAEAIGCREYCAKPGFLKQQ